ncbi:MAG: hypothetical protein HY735_19100 [Verrucomicrobia bacterium]|nr:hypothetical protein [Verrucomicrobiota bacterium]
MIVSLACLASLAQAEPSPAQVMASNSTPACQYLFVIDTSFSMARKKQALADTVSELVRTGANGQMRAGETLGFWTFNEQVYENRFQPTIWSPDTTHVLAGQIARFVKAQRFEKQTRLEAAMSGILNAAKTSRALAVFLLGDGDSAITGTPFDRSINLLYKERYRDSQRARKPFVTTLVAIEGRFVAWSVALGSTGVRVPEVLRFAQPMPINSTNMPTATNVLISSPVTLDPLKARVPQPTNAPRGAVAAPSPSRQALAPASAVPGSTEEKVPVVPQQAPPASTGESPSSAMAKAEQSSSTTTVLRPPADRVQAAPQGEVTPKTAEKASETSALSVTRNLPRPLADPPIEAAATPASNSGALARTNSLILPAGESPAAAMFPTRSRSATNQPATEAQGRRSAATAAGTPDSPVSGSRPAPAPPVRREQSAKPNSASSSPPEAKVPQQVAVAATEPQRNSSLTYLVSGLALLLTALSLLYWSIRNSRSHHRASLISRSLERRKE